MEITEKAAVVVGGASGMAKATAEMLVRKGAQESILDLPMSKGPQVAKELGGSFHACAVTGFEGTELALTAACDKLGALHFVCNTAGGGIALSTLSKKGPHPLDEFRRNLNLVATFNVARLAAARDRSCGADVLGQRTRPPDWTASTPAQRRSDFGLLFSLYLAKNAPSSEIPPPTTPVSASGRRSPIPHTPPRSS